MDGGEGRTGRAGKGSGNKQPRCVKCRDPVFQITRKPKGFMFFIVVASSLVLLAMNINVNMDKLLYKKIAILENCSDVIYGLARRRMINLIPPTWAELEANFSKTGIQLGGRWKPKNCTSRIHVAIIIPFRDRDSHLRVFLNNMHPFFQKQELDYRIYIVEQKAGTIFNRGLLLNIGFVESAKIDGDAYDCFALHDVDLIAENEWNIYNCSEKVKHMAANISKFKSGLAYEKYSGGVAMFTKWQYTSVNGYPNTYFGWGGEDDDLYERITNNNNAGFSRVPLDIGRYTMIKHERDSGNPVNPGRVRQLQSSYKRRKVDGLSGLNGTYTVLKIDEFLLYTRIYVDVDPIAVLSAIPVNLYGEWELKQMRKWVNKTKS
ncbi:beta-1,4-galactosyltransferase 4 [Lingula anatina]|uniref:Beta-1,4-galactosyltransferase n=1 Tax=Lingula anatina TaxID=7574 RepID=A0A1S3JZ30_LINAN|nr:beta-1,4-galactosyltransferase 4 [Lingula anatina]XP_013415335.1 beta-1,4-galactosyltransferase 4 [Lingula anatina]|eukprot:XP_013415334.1 beta-1,4-galactosyltransferase 4 [Lingula anatina]